MFEREDWKLFRNLDTLCQKAGVKKEQLNALIVKELVDNALDTNTKCEIGVLQNLNGFFVKDNGNGLPENIIENLFSINRPMITSKLLRLPTRGALGNGLRVVTGAIISTNGQLYVSTNGYKYELTFYDDGSAKKEIIGTYEEEGTKIEVILGNRVRFTESDLAWGQNAILFARGETHSCKTSPFWYTSESFFELLNAYSGDIKTFLTLFEGINKNKVDEIMNIIEHKHIKDFDFNDSEDIQSLLKEKSKKINHKKLGCCSENVALGQYAKKTESMIVKSVKGKHHAEIPYIVESWVKIQDKTVHEILVNKTPITGDVHSWYKNATQTLYGCGLIIDVKMKPSQFAINIITPYMPITSDGKSPNFAPMNEIIKDTLKTAANKAKKINTLLNNDFARNEKEIFYTYIEQAINKASGEGNYKFSQRQLYYALRPYIIQALDKQPDYGYFCRLLTDYENDYGNIKGLYRDARGTLYHPHLREDISIGTISVEEYERPAWTFNKILYCEKEGFFPILKDAKFPERFDCALLTSKGYASRAVKDLFDLLGDTDEEILFFCIHDSDAAGTMIYETLQHATNSRAGRRVKVINLGLDPWEAMDMLLEVEEVDTKGKKAVAQYIKDYDYDYYSDWAYWLQNNRIELNAMSTPAFLDWLEDKISIYDNGKVVPYTNVLLDKLTDEANNIIRQQIMEEILKANDFESIVKQKQKDVILNMDSKYADIKNMVRNDLYDNNETHWTDSIRDIAKQIVKK